eukprot:TRINITY_DN5766_c0_g1_i3.p1 TRINITY_DN5766_c0_g1~~TRINITY_DN5766_c0_g1_i3.p1  ORF type:complete len:169 (+),score=25.62 TRINITY_DN5766_c0_g1_i3:83-589(+)
MDGIAQEEAQRAALDQQIAERAQRVRENIIKENSERAFAQDAMKTYFSEHREHLGAILSELLVAQPQNPWRFLKQKIDEKIQEYEYEGANAAQNNEEEIQPRMKYQKPYEVNERLNQVRGAIYQRLEGRPCITLDEKDVIDRFFDFMGALSSDSDDDRSNIARAFVNS